MENRISIYESQYHLLNSDWNDVYYIGNYWRFYWNDRPGAIIEHLNAKLELKPDRYYIIPPLVRFKAKKFLNPRQFYFHFSLPQFKVQPHLGPLSFPLTPVVQTHIADIISELKEAPVFYSSSGFFTLLQLAGACLAELENHQSVTRILNDRMEKAISYIHLNLDRSIKSEDLSSHVHMGRSCFFDEFKSYTGLSPNLFVRTIKMEKARHRIKHTDQSIDGIADSLGYTDRFHFSKTFKKHFGVTPKQYRSNAS